MENSAVLLHSEWQKKMPVPGAMLVVPGATLCWLLLQLAPLVGAMTDVHLLMPAGVHLEVP